jgi:endonuclease YncB( thermonuclease family)
MDRISLGTEGVGKAVLFGLCLALLPPVAAHAEKLEGKIVSVLDGDSIVLRTEDKWRHNIRLSGIDAPEKGQPVAEESRQQLSELALGKTAVADCYKRQRRRQVCFVEVDGKDLGLEQLNAGLAWWYARYAHEQPLMQQMSYEAAARNAAAQRKGIWQDENPLPPWDWKKAKR